MRANPLNSLHLVFGRRRGPVGLACALLALWLATPVSLAWAQPPTAYRIGISDVLRIEISSRPNLPPRITVADDGTVTIPDLGSVPAAGLTTDELSGDLSRRLSLVDREIPRVRVTVVEARGRQIAVLGAVLVPGLYNLPADATPWSAIELAGGAADDADLATVQIIPADVATGRQTVTVDVASAIREGRLQGLEKLHPGDTVRVPRKGGATAGTGNLVYIFGSIGRQGAVPFEQAPDLFSLVRLSGGPGGDADLRRVEIVRKDGARYSHLRVDLQKHLLASDPAGNVDLHAGDTVYLPRRERRNYFFQVLGIISPALALTTTIIALSRR
jgi:protein involved in polysaccharide export with SLBB domain